MHVCFEHMYYKIYTLPFRKNKKKMRNFAFFFFNKNKKVHNNK